MSRIVQNVWAFTRTPARASRRVAHPNRAVREWIHFTTHTPPTRFTTFSATHCNELGPSFHAIDVVLRSDRHQGAGNQFIWVLYTGIIRTAPVRTTRANERSAQCNESDSANTGIRGLR